jgi:lactose/L-arabinose transport system permease protein
MIFYLAALQNIDRSIYEAARIDGVPPWARFVYITCQC